MCTRVLWNSNTEGVFVGRTMDWPESTDPILTVMPRGHARRGGYVGNQQIVADNPLEWTSVLGSVATSVYGIGTVDGINERGFSAHGLYLQSTDVGARNTALPGLHTGLWVQYLLDNAATVSEAVGLMEDVQLVMAEARGFQATLHVAVEDETADSAIFELVDGELAVHHGPEFRLMTNDPTYDEQLRLLAAQDYSHPSNDLSIPGNVNPVDRFQRAAYYSALLPQPATKQEAASSILSVMRNVSVPFGAPYRDFGVYNTEYRTVADLEALRYYFELTTNPSAIWTDLARLDLSEGAPVLTLDPHDLELAGNVSTAYQPASVAF